MDREERNGVKTAEREGCRSQVVIFQQRVVCNMFYMSQGSPMSKSCSEACLDASFDGKRVTL